MNTGPSYTTLNARAHQIFRHIVESYMANGDPVGSRTLSRNFDLSPATIRNVMADLEDLGYLEAAHISAGRIPSQTGLRFFIDGIMETGALSLDEQRVLENEYKQQSSTNTMLAEAGRVLSGISQSAGLVVTAKADKGIRHIEFVQLSSPGQAMVIIVAEDNTVENRIMAVPPGVTVDIMKRASNFLSERLSGKTLKEMTALLNEDISHRRGELGALLETVEKEGLAIPVGDGMLIVRGTSNLLDQNTFQDKSRLDHIRQLMEQLEDQKTATRLLEEAGQADGVKIFLGSENPVFQSTRHSMILTPYRNGAGTFIGAVGVIGPTHLNYAKIVPSVSFMAEIISRNIRKLSEP